MPAGAAGEAVPGPFSTGDVVFTFSYETLADARARGMMRPPDRILTSLVNRPDVSRVLVANPFRFVASALRRRPGAPERFGDTGEANVITPLRARRADPTGLEAIERTYRSYDRAIARASDSHRLSRPDVITTHPLVAGFAPMTWSSNALYFGRDDWASFPPRAEYWPAYREAYGRIARSGMPVAAVSQQIIDRIDPTGPHMVVPNGVEPSEWLGERPEPPAWFSAIAEPRAVYVGTLDDRLDVEGMRSLAQAKTDVQFVLVGPIPDPALLAPLQALANIHIHESVQRHDLVAILRHSQVSLVAHRRSPLTEAMSPLKAYEYIAAGLPVVSIDLAPITGISPRIILTDAVADFADVLDTALALGTETESARRAFIEQNSWARRHDAMFELLRQR